MTHGTSATRAAGHARRAVAGAGRPAMIAACCLALLFTVATASPALAAGRPRPAEARLGPVGGPQLAGHGVIANYPSRTSPRLPHVPASSYLITDAGTGQVLAGKDPHGWYPPASTLKVLTAITLMPVLRPGRRVTASRRAADIEPSKVGLVQGQKYTVAALFRALLLISANDAAIALAQATGSYHHAIAMMNAEARHLQADDTVAKRPNGLDAPGQHSSAYDLALFARRALAMPALMRDEQIRSMRFRQWPRHWEKLYNQNTMLASYPGDIFGKIGWTSPDKATFIGIARRHHVTLIVTIMHCRPLTEMTSAARLLNWGFAMDGKIRPIGHLVGPLREATAAPTVPARTAPPAAASSSGRLTGGSLALAAGTAGLAVCAGLVVLVSRRARRAGSQRAR